MCFKNGIAAALLVFLFSATGGEAADRTRAQIVGEFLERTPLSLSERQDVTEGIESASERTEWLMTGNGEVYSLVLRPVQPDARAAVRIKLEEMARSQSALKARHLLYLYAMPRERRAVYRYEDSVAVALIAWDEERTDSERLKLKTSVAMNSGEWAFALVVARQDALHDLTRRIEVADRKTLDLAYCAALYPKARELFDQKKYGEALPVYRELHSLRWARPAAYLDAAECFLYTGAPKDAALLTIETVNELGEEMSSTLLERAGDILLESGEEEQAEHLYRRAREKMQQEPGE